MTSCEIPRIFQRTQQVSRRFCEYIARPLGMSPRKKRERKTGSAAPRAGLGESLRDTGKTIEKAFKRSSRNGMRMRLEEIEQERQVLQDSLQVQTHLVRKSEEQLKNEVGYLNTQLESANKAVSESCERVANLEKDLGLLHQKHVQLLKTFYEKDEELMQFEHTIRTNPKAFGTGMAGGSLTTLQKEIMSEKQVTSEPSCNSMSRPLFPARKPDHFKEELEDRRSKIQLMTEKAARAEEIGRAQIKRIRQLESENNRMYREIENKTSEENDFYSTSKPNMFLETISQLLQTIEELNERAGFYNGKKNIGYVELPAECSIGNIDPNSIQTTRWPS